MKPARVQSCRYTGIYTQPFLQGLTPALPHPLGEHQGRKVQLLSGFLAHPSHTDLVWEFILTCWWIPRNRNKWQLSRQLQDLAGPWDVGIVPLDHACWKTKTKIMSLRGRFLWAKPVRQNEVTDLDKHPWGIFRRAITERYFNPVNPMAWFMNKGKLNHRFNWCGIPKVLPKSHTWVGMRSLKVNLNHSAEALSLNVYEEHTHSKVYYLAVWN